MTFALVNHDFFDEYWFVVSGDFLGRFFIDDNLSEKSLTNAEPSFM